MVQGVWQGLEQLSWFLLEDWVRKRSCFRQGYNGTVGNNEKLFPKN